MKQSSVPANKTDRLVQFKLQDAQRIASVVHTVESERRGRNPSRLPRAVGGGGGGVTLVKFTGAWDINTLKTVTISPGTNTIVAINLFANINPAPCGERNAAIARSGTSFVLIAAQSN